MSNDIHPYTIEISDAALTALTARIHDTRWPEAETPDDWSQGIPLDYVREVCEYWADGYDWRVREALGSAGGA